MSSTEETQLDERFFDVINLYNKGYCCSQIMAILALRDMGQENPELVRAMGGLCKGGGSLIDVCGVLSGGACILSLYSDKGPGREQDDDELPLMISELEEWFMERTGGTAEGIKCSEILTQNRNQRICLALTSETYDRVLKILSSHNLAGIEKADGI